MDNIEIICPDDWHCHFRDNLYLTRTAHDTAQRFGRAIIMPNLNPPVLTVVDAEAYRARILSALPTASQFMPLMTLYLCEKTLPETIREAAANPHIIGCKLYPAGVTTHSAHGIQSIRNIYPLLEVMEACDLPLLIHGESNDPRADVFDREAIFIDLELTSMIRRFPKLRVVLEHISTKAAVDFITETSGQVVATITAHHLLLNRNHLLDDGIRPHYYCKPILKRKQDQESLIQAAISGNPKFFLGTDSAPHSIANKESACGCAGVYTAHAAIELYAEIFEKNNALDKLENFSSVLGATFYKLPVNTHKIKLQKRAWTVPATLDFGPEKLVPFYANETLQWQVEGVSYSNE